MSNSHPTTKPAAPAKPATAPSAPATAPYTALNWAFPFSPVGKDDPANPMTYMKALASAEDGFYPLGANGMWHGGIHFDQNTAAQLKQGDGIRAIADGEVVAYRLDSKYPEQDYQDGRHALYSTGFVLIRHRLKLPPPAKPEPAKNAATQPATSSTAPATATPAPTSSTTPPGKNETLTFFSLYMHTMDHNSYQSAAEQARVAQVDRFKLNMGPMPYWEGDRYYRVGDKAKDKQEVPLPKVPVPSLRDTINRDVLGEFIQSDFKKVPEPEEDTKDTTPLPPPVTGLRIRELPNGKSKILGILPQGTELTVSDTDDQTKANPGWAKIKAIKSGTPAAAVVGQSVSPHAPYGYVFLGELDPIVDPKPLDTVVVLKQPYAVKAGDVIGQFGHYLRYPDAKLLPAKPTRPLLHLEVFAGPELEAFIQKSRERAKQLPASKAFLEISPGARLVTDLPEPDQKLQPGTKLVPFAADAKGKWVKVQPKTAAPVHGGRHTKPVFNDAGAPVWVDSSLANTTTTAIAPGWKDFPLSFSNAKGPGADFRDVFRSVDLEKNGPGSIAKDDKGRHWYYVEIGTKDGSTRNGWVCEQDHPLVRMCGPWDWPGFELVDNSSIMPVDMLKRYIHVAEQFLADESKTEFEASAATVNASPLITKLEKAIDTNHDGKVTAQELKHAQETPWIAEALSHLVVRCESEWGGGLGKWEALSPLMKKLLWLWKTEIERIGKLQWWEQVTSVEGFPKEPNPWHFHPVGIIGNFKVSSSTALDELIKKIGDIIASGEGGYDAYNTGTKDVPGGHVGHSYIHGGPGGPVTGKTINEILATEPLPGTNPNRLFATGKYQTIFPTLSAGKASLSLSGNEKYDADMQERMFRDYLFNKAGGGRLSAFVKHGKGTIDDAVFSASQEWASIAVPKGYPTNKVIKHPDGTKEKLLSDGTLTYFQNEGAANKASMTSTGKLREILEEIQNSR
ncbi:SH3 domain-containing protein [Burkholderia cenocepacia]|uniref:Calcium-binding protein n=1 Tax=Burkholderia cenocepacia (strain ATCC BAA-245 / DSM 16553 / LMG 16656 / NCTC 13227 / J2315 / CF5610) TaxID=216591 RepID=B4EDP7_BURCJ|nr:SH3 domain-containing protein [Burkholderia cenocepacia]KKI79595.1 calcium-binding protein [Burkholderia cenocepacia]MCG0581529.1 SH3 domain-containing protein [Burkholderia cenocepacia]ONX64375.1 calcium-binding protein [Burkholderia cenocepacia]ONX68918.1 calcium-binding protein [Burkholderia cenocepacia]ONX70282.1 calcium-binding protein [Burkholderia cenocepacia]